MSTEQHLLAVCAGTETGYRLRVLSDADTRDLVRLDLDWDAFHPASAGHRLIEQGYMIRPDARGPETVNGWREIPGQDRAWSVQVVPTDDVIG
jgi:hypothetical protein